MNELREKMIDGTSNTGGTQTIMKLCPLKEKSGRTAELSTATNIYQCLCVQIHIKEIENAKKCLVCFCARLNPCK